ncbi:hypothetical protein [Demequina globuliformis]|uniref:hypothetical protein n=1 Tax=Demequina globuliformis TaxID=676202 RepID=UPI000781310A|nr:hypothetical protein [Demequina globuliformis]
MQEYELTRVQVRNAVGTFVMDCEDGQRIEFELTGVGRDHVRLVSTKGAATGFAGLRASLLWVMSGPDDHGQEEPAVLRVGMAHSVFVRDGDDVHTIEVPIATALSAVDWEFNSEVPVQEWPQAVLPAGHHFKPSTPPPRPTECTDHGQRDGGD